MPEPFDVGAVVAAIEGNLSAMLNKDIKEIVGFEERQLAMLSGRAQLVAARLARLEITLEDAQESLADIEDDAKTLAMTLAALVALEAEKVWNAIVGAIWGALNGAISGAIDAAFPIPRFPGE